MPSHIPMMRPGTLPQRIRAGCDMPSHIPMMRPGTLPQRIRAGCDHAGAAAVYHRASLPQRIRAGCDIKLTVDDVDCYLCHSAFVRVATHCYKLCKIGQTLCLSAFARVATQEIYAKSIPIELCHSAFVRVATRKPNYRLIRQSFATAHSCGLRRFITVSTFAAGSLPQRIRAGCDGGTCRPHESDAALPQRIRAGCDCGKAMQRTANLLREGR